MKKILVFLLLSFLLVNCASCNKKNNQTNDTQKVLRKKVEENTRHLGPETALVKATLLEVDNSNILMFRIDKVFEYGHSTPTITKGEEIYAKFKNNKKEEVLTIGKSSEVLLKHLHSMQGEPTSVEWKVITLK